MWRAQSDGNCSEKVGVSGAFLDRVSIVSRLLLSYSSNSGERFYNSTSSL